MKTLTIKLVNRIMLDQAPMTVFFGQLTKPQGNGNTRK